MESYRLSADQRQASLSRALAQAPHNVATVDTWLFAYGSMLEDPPFEPLDREVVACSGWRRSFCLADPILRGDVQNPGLTLGLEPGGQCTGVAWRLSAQTLRRDLQRVWAAELEMPLYSPSWQIVQSPLGSTLALVLLADRSSALFEPSLSTDQIITRLATCVGQQGSNRDYLYKLADQLSGLGIPDLELTRLALHVRRASQLGTPKAG